MSRRCDLCGKGPRTIVDRSHSHQATKRIVYPNLQTRRRDGETLQYCTSCLKTQVKQGS
ncbi:50S ribosomal protein L28 [Candidatus Uhrbacteria bacterium]|nr:50S ribosomal protein L28 [Candidatus Uhrbacteria bacterium]